MDKIIYLDHAASTPMDEQVLRAMLPYMVVNFFNPSSPYAPANQVKKDYIEAKNTIARVLGVKSSELIMTAGATESINLAFNGRNGNFAISDIEHQSVLSPASEHKVNIITADENGYISPESVVRAIDDSVTLVSVALANNEIGVIQPIADIAKKINQIREDRKARGIKLALYLHCDASQGAGLIDLNVSRLGVDMLTLNAGKIYGPKQVGLLWVNNDVPIKPIILGGGQESGNRSGTENVAGVMGFSVALELAERRRKSEVKRLTLLRDFMQRKLTNHYPNAIVTASKKPRLASHLHIALPGIDAERIIYGLENKGVLIATGSACAANKETKSHVLEAIKMPEQYIQGSFRISLGKLNDSFNIESAVEIIISTIDAEYERLAK